MMRLFRSVPSRVAVVAGLAPLVVLTGSTPADGGSDPFAALPGEIVLTGTARDFRERTAPGGHPDFERAPTGGFGQYANIVADDLDADGKPRFKSSGTKVGSQFRDAQGRSISPTKSYIASRPGDRQGNLSSTASGAVTGEAGLRQWFRDVPGVNQSKPVAITLQRKSGTNTYTFSDRTDSTYAKRGGFFPINGELYGNSGGGGLAGTNYHFTYELSTEFKFEAGKGQIFRFTGDDDVWVFIDNKLVIDIGGVHGAVDQVIDLDRLAWLADGKTYSLKFFFAERHRTQSNFMIETTLNLRSVTPPATTGLHD